jgi:hypothetical protein
VRLGLGLKEIGLAVDEQQSETATAPERQRGAENDGAVAA